MSDLPIRRATGASARANDPFELVRDAMRRMEDLFYDPLFQGEATAWPEAGRLGGFTPTFEVRDTADGLVFNADLPGVKEDDLDITVVGNRLRIQGKREIRPDSRGDTWYAAERGYGTFSRSFLLPASYDLSAIEANLEDGVLTLRVAKPEVTQPRRIPVRARAAAFSGIGGPAQAAALADTCGTGVCESVPAEEVPAASVCGAVGGYGAPPPGYGGSMYGAGAPAPTPGTAATCASDADAPGASAPSGAPPRVPRDEPEVP